MVSPLSLYLAAYDDRRRWPGFIPGFVAHTLRRGDLHVISPCVPSAAQRRRWEGLPGRLTMLHPARIPFFTELARQFDLGFINLSTNPGPYERTCFLRWLSLLAASQHLGDEAYVALLDTDFLLGPGAAMVLDAVLEAWPAERRDTPPQLIAHWSGDRPVSIGPELTFLRRDALRDFCEYLIVDYFAPENRRRLMQAYFSRIGHGQHGGVCDMRALADFAEQHAIPRFNIATLPGLGFVHGVNGAIRNWSAKDPDWMLELGPDELSVRVGGERQFLVGAHFQGDSKLFLEPALRAGRLDRPMAERLRAEADRHASSLPAKAGRKLKALLTPRRQGLLLS